MNFISLNDIDSLEKWVSEALEIKKKSIKK